mmetsp:Transcript_41676/g.107884  ORF Transcript_41676/g.107884 Transcript_41676/m.107884 type:complete len:248 (-) Transcript_41676:306-1049(-)
MEARGPGEQDAGGGEVQPGVLGEGGRAHQGGGARRPPCGRRAVGGDAAGVQDRADVPADVHARVVGGGLEGAKGVLRPAPRRRRPAPGGGPEEGGVLRRPAAARPVPRCAARPHPVRGQAQGLRVRGVRGEGAPVLRRRDDPAARWWQGGSPPHPALRAQHVQPLQGGGPPPRHARARGGDQGGRASALPLRRLRASLRRGGGPRQVRCRGDRVRVGHILQHIPVCSHGGALRQARRPVDELWAARV